MAESIWRHSLGRLAGYAHSHRLTIVEAVSEVGVGVDCRMWQLVPAPFGGTVPGDGTITLLLGNGDGTFTPSPGSPYPAGAGPYAITAADFNGDGKLDLAVANLTAGTVSILLQQ